MPPTPEQDALKHELRVALMIVQTEHFKTQIKWEPWKAMAVAAGAGSGLTLAILGVVTALLRGGGHSP